VEEDGWGAGGERINTVLEEYEVAQPEDRVLQTKKRKDRPTRKELANPWTTRLCAFNDLDALRKLALKHVLFLWERGGIV